ncbi:hypothetical protein BC834DRAFT_157150 [Gloeopeniophorella convolvens]|nr:hypothetical protein BC834DRAFT_157150 [Gloeopeniophorella convolvens]
MQKGASIDGSLAFATDGPPAGLSLSEGFPVELLQEIFSYCVDSYSHMPPTVRLVRLCVQPQWIPITYVCRYWRTISLNHHTLWTSISPNLSTTWIKAFMERSYPLPVDVYLFLDDPFFHRSKPYECPSVNDAITLFAGCTRMCSLRLSGRSDAVFTVLAALRAPAPVTSLVICISGQCPEPLLLPEGIFNGRAPIRHLDLVARLYIVAPSWLLQGVTSFTTAEQIPLHALLAALRQMAALTHLKLLNCRASWELDITAPTNDLVPLPHLEVLTVRAHDPRYFALLCCSIARPPGVVLQQELAIKVTPILISWTPWLAAVRMLADAAGGMKNMRITGSKEQGTLCAWTGDTSTPDLNAQLHFAMKWDLPPSPRSMATYFPVASEPVSIQAAHFHWVGRLCGAIGAKAARRFALNKLDPACAELPWAHWSRLLEQLPGVVELELDTGTESILRSAWMKDRAAAAVLPALQSVRVVSPDEQTTHAHVSHSDLIGLLQGRAAQLSVPGSIAVASSADDVK